MGYEFKKTEFKNLYVRRSSGVYYIRYMQKKIRKHFSLHTKNNDEAMRIYYIWREAHKIALFTGKSAKDIFDLKLIQSMGMNSTDLSDIKIPEKLKSQETPIDGFDLYLHTCRKKKLSDGTIKLKELLLKKIREKGLKSFNTLSQSWINDFTDLLLHEYSESYVSKLMQELKFFINYCVKKGYLRMNSFDYFHVKTGNRRAATDEEIIMVPVYCREKIC